MGRQIKISPETMNNTATKFAQKADQVSGINREIISLVENLRNDWSGVSEEYFYSKFEEWKKLSQIYESELKSISDELRMISTKFSDTDQQLSRSV